MPAPPLPKTIRVKGEAYHITIAPLMDVQGLTSLSTRRIAISDTADDPGLVLAHELGHALAHECGWADHNEVTINVLAEGMVTLLRADKKLRQYVLKV